jgi:hypothetical protein
MAIDILGRSLMAKKRLAPSKKVSKLLLVHISSRLPIWLLKTLFCTVDYTVRRMKFEIENRIGDQMGKMLEIV